MDDLIAPVCFLYFNPKILIAVRSDSVAQILSAQTMQKVFDTMVNQIGH